MSFTRIDTRMDATATGVNPSDDIDTSTTLPPRRGTKLVKGLVSALLAFHLIALFVAPVVGTAVVVVEHAMLAHLSTVSGSVNLNHGYHFFAPEPGPSHLVRYTVERRDGTTVEGIIPDLKTNYPRLVYHRHFMLTEYLNRLAIEADETEDPKSLNAVAKSFADHLLHQYRGESVTLHLRRHYIPSPQQVRDGVPLDDPSLYAERPLGRFNAEGMVDTPDELRQRSPTLARGPREGEVE